MNRAEKEEYLREYSLLKAQGKPFFPYAVAKDSAMACVVMAPIIVMSIVPGPEPGPDSPIAGTSGERGDSSPNLRCRNITGD